MALVLVLVLVLVGACSGGRSQSARGERAAGERASAQARAVEPEQPPRGGEPSCGVRTQRALDALAGAGERACAWDHECALVEPSCLGGCARAVHASGVAAAVEANATAERESCAALRGAGCELVERRCATQWAACVDGACTELTEEEIAARSTAAPPVPPHNRADLAEAPPRPPSGDADERARRLFDAIASDDPRRAADLFFPREAFLLVKRMSDPGAYWDRLFAHYERDVHALHDALPDLARATFDRLEIVPRGGWVAVGEEANALPYWVSRHSVLHYTVDGDPRSFEVRVLITWDDRWYVTHLSEFR